MGKFKLSASMRLFFMLSGCVLWLGIWLTGFAVAHWVMYLPATFFLVAAITGICPGVIVTGLLFVTKKTD